MLCHKQQQYYEKFILIKIKKTNNNLLSCFTYQDLFTQFSNAMKHIT